MAGGNMKPNEYELFLELHASPLAMVEVRGVRAHLSVYRKTNELFRQIFDDEVLNVAGDIVARLLPPGEQKICLGATQVDAPSGRTFFLPLLVPLKVKTILTSPNGNRFELDQGASFVVLNKFLFSWVSCQVDGANQDGRYSAGSSWLSGIADNFPLRVQAKIFRLID
jgi:hypothetical protein